MCSLLSEYIMVIINDWMELPSFIEDCRVQHSTADSGPGGEIYRCIGYPQRLLVAFRYPVLQDEDS